MKLFFELERTVLKFTQRCLNVNCSTCPMTEYTNQILIECSLDQQFIKYVFLTQHNHLVLSEWLSALNLNINFFSPFTSRDSGEEYAKCSLKYANNKFIIFPTTPQTGNEETFLLERMNRKKNSNLCSVLHFYSLFFYFI